MRRITVEPEEVRRRAVPCTGVEQRLCYWGHGFECCGFPMLNGRVIRAGDYGK